MAHMWQKCTSKSGVVITCLRQSLRQNAALVTPRAVVATHMVVSERLCLLEYGPHIAEMHK